MQYFILISSLYVLFSWQFFSSFFCIHCELFLNWMDYLRLRAVSLFWGHEAAARKRSHQWCVSLTPNNTKTMGRMTCHCFQRPIRRDLTSSSYTTAFFSDLGAKRAWHANDHALDFSMLACVHSPHEVWRKRKTARILWWALMALLLLTSPFPLLSSCLIIIGLTGR